MRIICSEKDKMGVRSSSEPVSMPDVTISTVNRQQQTIKIVQMESNSEITSGCIRVDFDSLRKKDVYKSINKRFGEE